MADPADNATEGPSAEALALAEKGRSGTIDLPDPLVKLTPAPAGIPEKFWDPVEGKLRTEDLITSYSELEKKLGGQKAADEGGDEEPDADKDKDPDPAADSGDQDEDPDGDKDGDEDGDKDADEAAPLAAAVEAAQVAYAETGELADEVRQPLRDAGITDEQIDLYLQGVKATEAALEAAVTGPFGSREAYDEASAWAATAWTPKQIAAFNSQTGSVETAQIAGKMLYEAYKAANPGEGSLVNINSGANRGDVYEAMADFHDDLRKADAVRDQNARNKAIDKLRRSRQFKTLKR